jgi:hypothetical protein
MWIFTGSKDYHLKSVFVLFKVEFDREQLCGNEATKMCDSGTALGAETTSHDCCLGVVSKHLIFFDLVAEGLWSTTGDLGLLLHEDLPVHQFLHEVGDPTVLHETSAEEMIVGELLDQLSPKDGAGNKLAGCITIWPPRLTRKKAALDCCCVHGSIITAA